MSLPPAPAPQPLMRADFTLFDEYLHSHAAAPPFTFPVTAFWGRRDRRITERMVQVGWAAGGGACVMRVQD